MNQQKKNPTVFPEKKIFERRTKAVVHLKIPLYVSIYKEESINYVWRTNN